MTKKTCLSVDCPERSGGGCNATPENDRIDQLVENYIPPEFQESRARMKVAIEQLLIAARIEELEVYGGSVYVGNRIDTLKHGLAELKKGLDTNHE